MRLNCRNSSKTCGSLRANRSASRNRPHECDMLAETNFAPHFGHVDSGGRASVFRIRSPVVWNTKAQRHKGTKNVFVQNNSLCLCDLRVFVFSQRSDGADSTPRARPWD